MDLLVKFLVLSWILCGPLLYGLLKAHYRDKCILIKRKYSWKQELVCWAVAPLNLIGLVIVTEVLGSGGRIAGSKTFCFRMPKELKE